MFNSELFLHISSMRVSLKLVIGGMKVASSIVFNESVKSRAGAIRISWMLPFRPISHKKCLVIAVAGASARSLTASSQNAHREFAFEELIFLHLAGSLSTIL